MKDIFGYSLLDLSVKTSISYEIFPTHLYFHTSVLVSNKR